MKQNSAATANHKRGEETYNGLFGRCKLGWNWRFDFVKHDKEGAGHV